MSTCTGCGGDTCDRCGDLLTTIDDADMCPRCIAEDTDEQARFEAGRDGRWG